ncbi:MAG: cob(I)yrinic acid a,c-diamide adenosyltransferase [Ignavibacteriae bacterium]|nr:cob(I)yrinic acid a,c-diamide adenosyltransferase [Ignavibacteriota bacterium]
MKTTLKKADGGKKLREKMLKTIEGYKNLSEEDKHCLHIYYGYGKGKTTSTIGLAIRALGAGKKVVMIQFDKGYDGRNEHYSERNILRKLKADGYPIEMIATGCERMNSDGTFRFKNTKSDFSEAKKGLKISKEYINGGKQDLLILDEVIAAAAYNLLDKKDIEELAGLFNKNKRFELVMTGHKIWPEIEDCADLITEMKKVKHYFDKGIPAREGIEF